MLFKDLAKLKNSSSFSISPENFTGEKSGGARAKNGTGENASRELGIGWKVSPSVRIQPKSDFVMGEIQGQGIINHIWLTCSPNQWRTGIFKIYWDGESEPSIYCPVGDFFCNGWCTRSNVNSLAVTVNPAGGFNCYFPMPFRKGAKIVMQNLSDDDMILYYQIDFERTEVSKDMAYLHAQFRSSSPLKYKEVHTILDGVSGKGQYVGTYIAWQVNSNGWWGEGEVKFYIDGDDEYPTICSTGTEDYFGGAWNFEHPQGEYGLYSTAYQGLTQVIKPDGLYRANTRFSMYRWHITDPIYFDKDLRVTIQALGWRSKDRYLPLQDNIYSVAYWYQSEPHKSFFKEFDYDELEVN